MIKVSFSELMSESQIRLDYQDDYIPFTLSIIGNATVFDTIYARNLFEKNFIEFRFDQDTKVLYEITCVVIQSGTVENVKLIEIDNVRNVFYACRIEEIGELLISMPITIKKSDSALSLAWDSDIVDYFPVGKNCYVGIDRNSCLSSVVLTALSEEQLRLIFDFVQ